MTRSERREQLIAVARSLFAEKGFDGTSVEEIAARADVSKPVVYEHFGGKEGLYAVIVDRESRSLHDSIRTALLTQERSRNLIELSTLALLDYIDEHPDGFQIISRDSSPLSDQGTFGTILSDVISRVENLLADQFTKAGFNPHLAPMYAQMLTGLVASSGKWWLDNRVDYALSREMVAAHVVNLVWNGLRNVEVEPKLRTRGQSDANQPAPPGESGTGTRT